VIITADGQPVDRVSTLQRIVRNHAPGENVEIEVMRYGQKKSFRVRLQELEESARVATVAPTSNPGSGSSAPSAGTSSSTLGITMQAIPSDVAAQANLDVNRRGVLVTEVVPLGASYGKLYPRDVIFEVLYPGPRRVVRTPADLAQVVGRLRNGNYLSLNVRPLGEGGQDRVVNIRIGD
jgi:serine protease Do